MSMQANVKDETGAGESNTTNNNAAILKEIAEKEKKKAEYETVQASAKSIAIALEGLADDASQIGKSLEEIIVNKKTFDDGKLEALSKNFTSSKGAFDGVVSACQTKIDELETDISNLNRQIVTTR